MDFPAAGNLNSIYYKLQNMLGKYRKCMFLFLFLASYSKFSKPIQFANQSSHFCEFQSSSAI